MTRHLNTALPFSSWPCKDQKAWQDRIDSLDIFDDSPGAHLSNATRYGRKCAYGMWLGFLDAFYTERLALQAPDRVTPRHVEDYVSYLRENNRDTTIAHQLGRLFYVLRAMHPEYDWSWLYRISRRIAGQAQPLQRPMVMSSDLYALGLRLLEKAEARSRRAARITKSAAMMYRDGLLISTLVEAPMRRHAFSQLRLQENLFRTGGRWLIAVPPELTKTRLEQEYLLSPRLSKAMDIYLEHYRPAFPGADNHDRLWTYIGRPMSDKMIRRRTIHWTRGWLGFGVSPHRFRHAAATYIIAADPENVRVAKDLLGHRSFAMTEKHYIDAAQSRVAGRALEAILNAPSERMGDGG